jgi:hypothetical protein
MPLTTERIRERNITLFARTKKRERERDEMARRSPDGDPVMSLRQSVIIVSARSFAILMSRTVRDSTTNVLASGGNGT